MYFPSGYFSAHYFAPGYFPGLIPVAISPTLETLSPSIGSVGDTIAVVLVGTHLDVANLAVIVSGGGVSVAIYLPSITANQVTAIFTISSLAAVGNRSVIATTDAGVSNDLPFTIGSVRVLPPTNSGLRSSILPVSGLRPEVQPVPV